METLLNSIRVQDVFDIILVAAIIYHILLWFKGSRASQLVKGFLFLTIIFIASKWAGLYTIEWLMSKMATIVMISLVVVFQPELRRGLEKLGRHFFLSNYIFDQPAQEMGVLNKIVKAAHHLSEKKIGAIIVIERNTGLNEFLESGIRLDAELSEELLISIFNNSSPLHDGAVIIQDEQVAAACCLLPLSDSKFVDRKLGTRHRAAIGISELSDAVVVVVSEETGVISVAENSTITRYLNKETLKENLLSIYQKEHIKFDLKITNLFKRDNKKTAEKDA